MSTIDITQPVAEPVTVAQVRLACRLDVTGDMTYDAAVDDELKLQITAARELATIHTQASIMPMTWELSLDAFPMDNDIELLYPRIISITSVKYISALTGQETLLVPNQYTVDSQRYRAWLLPAVGITWPDTADVANAVKVRYVAGFADAASVPAKVKQWILSVVRYMREGGCNGAGEIPWDFNASLLADIDTHR
jgi:uncharacterized phiE125 gp8 family phage protein